MRFDLLLIGMTLLNIPLSATECRCPAQNEEDLKEQATYVFKAVLSELRVDKKTKERRLEFDIQDNYKGLPPNIDFRPIDATQGSDCPIEFKERKGYLVYAKWEWGLTYIKPCSGTVLLTEEDQPAAQVLGPGDIWKQKLYDKLQIDCMGLASTTCCLGALKRMKEERFLPEPPGGCPEGTVPNRLRCADSPRWCQPIHP